MVKKTQSSHHRYGILIAIIINIVVLLAIVAYILLRESPYTPYGILYDPPEVAADFTLIDQNGDLFHLSDQRGKVVLIFFGFTQCPEACPLTLGIWNHVSRLLRENAEKVQFIFISVDPERDTPEQITRHLSFFSADIAGLTGTLAEIEDVASAYSVFFQKVDAETEGDYWLNHTTLTFVVDQSGMLVEGLPYGTRAEDIVADLEYLLR